MHSIRAIHQWFVLHRFLSLRFSNQGNLHRKTEGYAKKKKRLHYEFLIVMQITSLVVVPRCHGFHGEKKNQNDDKVNVFFIYNGAAHFNCSSFDLGIAFGPIGILNMFRYIFKPCSKTKRNGTEKLKMESMHCKKYKYLQTQNN